MTADIVSLFRWTRGCQVDGVLQDVTPGMAPNVFDANFEKVGCLDSGSRDANPSESVFALHSSLSLRIGR